MKNSFNIVTFLSIVLLCGILNVRTRVVTAIDRGENLTPYTKIVSSFDTENTGGACAYISYKGKAIVVSIEKIGNYQGTLPYQPYEVKFIVRPLEAIKEAFVSLEGKEWQLRLENSYPPGKRFLEKYGIHKGASFDCLIKVIKKGTCAPVLIEFPNMDLRDRGYTKKIL